MKIVTVFDNDLNVINVSWHCDHAIADRVLASWLAVGFSATMEEV
jgi:hypothetical protein